MIAIYLRVSTNDKGQDTAMQHREIQSFLKAKNVTEFKVYEDKGFSGTKANRPALNELLKDCKAGKISEVVCWKLDRLFRSLKHLMDTLAEFENREVKFVALKDGIDLSTATGRLMMHIIGAFAEFEAAVIKERVIAGIENAKAKGVRLGRPVATGAQVMLKLRSEGHSVREISERLEIPVRTVYNGLKRGNK